VFGCVVKIVKRSALKIGEAQRINRLPLFSPIVVVIVLVAVLVVAAVAVVVVAVVAAAACGNHGKPLHAQTPDNERLTCEPLTDCHIGRLPLKSRASARRAPEVPPSRGGGVGGGPNDKEESAQEKERNGNGTLARR